MARLGDVVFDCRHPAALAGFWASVLDGYAVAPYDEAELARLGSLGIEDPEDDPTVVIESSSSDIRLWFQHSWPGGTGGDVNRGRRAWVVGG